MTGEATVRSLAELESAIDASERLPDAAAGARTLLAIAEAILEHWVVARGQAPTNAEREGFRLLALHRQGAHDLPSFNACRETCREIAYHYNLIHDDASAGSPHQRMMALLVRHLFLFVSGKLQVEGLGEFCCASRPLRAEATAR